MQTVNFTCGHCGNLIAADQSCLGRQVRCPYCQQVAPVTKVANPPLSSTETEPNAQRISPEEAGDDAALMRRSAPPSHSDSLGSRFKGLGTMPLLIVPLVSYAILATATIVWLLLQPKPPHPLEMIPDLEGENKGAKRVPGSSQAIKLPRADIHLPAHLCAGLGRTIQIGDVEVTPKKVQRGRLRFRTEGYAEIVPASKDSLLLWLHVRNASRNVMFKPMDSFFDRRWKKGTPVGVMPFTFLAMGQKCFYGGPLDYWKSHSVRRDPRHAEPRESLEGQNYDRELKPGEELTTFVCTDPDDQAVQALDNYQGPLLWRVQIRRGLVAYRNRELSATAVIGIEFHSQDVQKDTN